MSRRAWLWGIDDGIFGGPNGVRIMPSAESRQTDAFRLKGSSDTHPPHKDFSINEPNHALAPTICRMENTTATASRGQRWLSVFFLAGIRQRPVPGVSVVRFASSL
jgi:hypothetical protein